MELAGALAEIARKAMLPDFPSLRPEELKIVLLEAGHSLLSSYPAELAQKAERFLKDLGVRVQLNTQVTQVSEQGVTTGQVSRQPGARLEASPSGFIETVNILWAAGNAASPLLQSLKVPLDRQGRAIVGKDLTIPGDAAVFVIGDAAPYEDKKGECLPALAPVAMQQGRYVARIIRKRIPPEKRTPFVYADRGSLATIGKAKAVGQLGPLRLSRLTAWLLWSLVHIFYLIGFRNRFRVMFEWIWYYLTYQPGARSCQ